MEWITHAENIRHSFRTNPQRQSSAPKQCKPVECYINEKWEKYASASEAARQLNLRGNKIRRACKKGYLINGYRIRYGTPDEPEKLANEEWRTIPDSKAQVSSTGRYKDVQGVIKTPSAHPNGYVIVMLDNKNHQIHRLIARCFLPPPQPGQTQVNHKDGNPLNNHLSNLEWVTPKENIMHSFANNRNRKSHAPQLCKKVKATKDGQIQTFASTAEAARRLGISQGYISEQCHQNAKIASQ